MLWGNFKLLVWLWPASIFNQDFCFVVQVSFYCVVYHFVRAVSKAFHHTVDKKMYMLFVYVYYPMI